MNIERISDSGFESIDLGSYECDICRHETTEALVECLLSDDFAHVLASSELSPGPGCLTRAHQQCLDRWTDIIERNEVVRKKATEKKIQWTGCLAEKTNGNQNAIISSNESQPTLRPRGKHCSFVKPTQTYDRQALASMSTSDINQIIRQLKDAVTGMSAMLIDQLQTRDDLSSEIATQKQVIAQVIENERSAIGAKDVARGAPVGVTRHSLSA